MGFVVPIVIGDVIQVNAYTYCGNQLGVNRYHYIFWKVAEPGGANVTGQLDDLAFQLVPEASTKYAPCMSEQASFLGCGIKRLTTTPTPPEVPYEQELAGSMNSAPLPGQVCGIITKYGIKNNNATVGRVYMPFPGEEANNNEALPSGVYVANLAEVGLALMANRTYEGLSGINFGLQPIIMNNPRTPLIYADQIGFQAKSKWATHKSRGSYGRPNALWP